MMPTQGPDDPKLADWHPDYWAELPGNPSREAPNAIDDPTPSFPAERSEKNARTTIVSPRTASLTGTRESAS